MTNNRYSPLGGRDRGSRRHLMLVLDWMWSLVLSVALLAIVVFGNVWLSTLLVAAGFIVTIYLFRRTRTRRAKLAPVPHLSGASKCVWQMDREA